MLSKTLESEWLGFSRKCMAHFTEDGLRDAKAIFFAGANAMYLMIHVAAMSAEDDRDEAVRRLKNLGDEADDVLTQVISEIKGGETN